VRESPYEIRVSCIDAFVVADVHASLLDSRCAMLSCDARSSQRGANTLRRTHFVKAESLFFNCAVVITVSCGRDSCRHGGPPSTYLGEQHGEESEEGKGCQEGCEEKGRREEAQVNLFASARSTSNVVEGLRHVLGMIDKRNASAAV